jgi:hypothetical protein
MTSYIVTVAQPWLKLMARSFGISTTSYTAKMGQP